MKKYLRSSLALMLALCLLVGMCPAAFAAEGDSIWDYSQEQILVKLLEVLKDFWPEADPNVNPLEAVTYEPKDGSYYVALGDSSAASSNYVTLLANELGVESKNLGKADMVLVEETYAVVDNNRKDIREADLITLGYSAHVFLNNAVMEGLARVMGNSSSLNMDWVKLLGEDYAKDVEMLLNDLQNYLTSKDITGVKQKAVMGLVEAFAYSAADYAVHIPQLVAAIRELNPDATIVLFGMYNPIENVKIDTSSVGVDIETYMQQVMDAMDAHANAVSQSTTNCAYVPIYSTETTSEAEGLSLEVDLFGNFTTAARSWSKVSKTMNPSENGGKYIMNRFLLTMIPIFRVAGGNRFETAFKSADTLKATLDVKRFDTIIVSCGTEFADALSGSYLATVKNAPILLSYQNGLSNNNKDLVAYIKANLKEDGTVYILGGEKAVSPDLDKDLSRGGIAAVKRLQGANRFLTNIEVLKEAGVGTNDILICTGLGFADSLSASATGLPILLVYGKTLLEEQKVFLYGLGGRNALHIIGGESAVSGNIQTAVSEYGNVDRVSGSNRITTSVEIADKFYGSVDRIVLASAANYPDGLCAGPLGFSLGAPLLLTMEGHEAAIASYVTSLDIEQGIILGGTSAVSEKAADASFGK